MEMILFLKELAFLLLPNPLEAKRSSKTFQHISLSKRETLMKLVLSTVISINFQHSIPKTATTLTRTTCLLLKSMTKTTGANNVMK